jgi:hypothetical protein
MIKKRLLTDRSGNLLDQILEDRARDLANQIDADVFMMSLIESGWHQVVLYPMEMELSYEIDQWVESNIKGQMWNRGIVWVFENDRDAMWFKLKWL